MRTMLVLGALAVAACGHGVDLFTISLDKSVLYVHRGERVYLTGSVANNSSDPQEPFGGTGGTWYLTVTKGFEPVGDWYRPVTRDPGVFFVGELAYFDVNSTAPDGEYLAWQFGWGAYERATFDVHVVPEPSACLVLLIGGAMLKRLRHPAAKSPRDRTS